MTGINNQLTNRTNYPKAKKLVDSGKQLWQCFIKLKLSLIEKKQHWKAACMFLVWTNAELCLACHHKCISIRNVSCMLFYASRAEHRTESEQSLTPPPARAKLKLPAVLSQVSWHFSFNVNQRMYKLYHR